MNPTSAALGTLIASPSLTSICINGSAQTGSCTVGTANGAGVVEVTTIESSGSNECGGVSPCSGLAFTITYQIVSAAASSVLDYPTAPGCSTSSVSSPSNLCVLVDDAFGTTLPEIIQTPAATLSQNVAGFQSGVCIVYPSTTSVCPPNTPSYGPFSVGSVFTVGVLLQNSQPIGGFDLYVAVDSNFLHPVGAALGTLITNPTLTSICINGSAQNGTCTPNTVNGPDVVECSSIEASGLNDPGNGLLCTISFLVVHETTGTPIFFPSAPACSFSSIGGDTCVLISDSLGNILPEAAQGAIVFTNTTVESTLLIFGCVPDPVVVGQPTVCTVRVTDPTGLSGPIGGIVWTTDGFGAFNPNACNLQPDNSGSSSCSVIFRPQHTGIIDICVIYDPVHPPPFSPPDPTHTGSTACVTLRVIADTPVLSTTIIVDRTDLPPASGIVLDGSSVHDDAIMIAGTGYPVTGVTGLVSYLLFSNNACNGAFTPVSNSTVQSSNNVAPSLSVTPAVGNYSFQALYHPDTTDNNLVTSPCEPFTVIPNLTFLGTKIHWTHHLSLSKTSDAQSWTFTGVSNPLKINVNLVVRIVGTSTLNPSLSFDITCGTVCVNTASGGVNFTNSTLVGSILIAPGASVSFSFTQTIPSTFAGSKMSFTATIWWTVGTVNPDGSVTVPYNPSSSKSGSFAVVP